MFGAASNTSASPFSLNNTAQSSGLGTTNAASGGLFGGQQKKPATGAFGSSNTGGLFGSNPAAGASQPGANSAASGGLFGQKPPTSTGFGAPSATSAPTTPFGLKPTAFGAPAQPAAAPGASSTAGGGLFGNNSNASGGLFGKSNTGTTTGGMFGASNTGNAPSGGLFGNTASTSSNTNTSGQGGGLFGGTSNTGTSNNLFGSSNNAASGGLFGQKPASGGLFSNNSTGPKPLFGGSTAQPSGGLFGGQQNTQNNQGGLFGGSAQAQQQQQQPQQQQLTAMTRVGDLPAEFRNELQQFDTYISTQHLIATTLNADLQKHDQLVKSIPSDVNYLHTKISSIKQALRFDAEQLKSLKEVNDELTEDIGNIMQLIVQLSTPGTKLSSSFHLNEFFVKRINKYKELLLSYEKVIGESTEVTAGLELACSDTMGSIFNVVEVVKNQYALFMELCEVLAQVHSEIGNLGQKQVY